MNFQLRSLAAAFRPKVRLSDTALDDIAPRLRPKAKPASGLSQAWKTCRRKAAQLNLRPRRFSSSPSSSSSSSSSKPTSLEETQSSISSATSMAKPILQVEYKALPELEDVPSNPSVSKTSNYDAPLSREVSSGQIVYHSVPVEAYLEMQEAIKCQFVEEEPERGGAPHRGRVLTHSPTVVSVTSDYDASVADDGSCYRSFTGDRLLVVESYLELQAETERSFIDRF